jgi:hypothetical protein
VSQFNLHILRYPLSFEGDVRFPDPRPVYPVQERAERITWRLGRVLLFFHMELIAPFPPNPAHAGIRAPILVIPKPNPGSSIPSVDLHNFGQVPAIRGTGPLREGSFESHQLALPE